MLPNFFIVGAAKSGTTSIWQYLSQHPEIYFPQNKEPNYFAYRGLELPVDSGPASSDELYRKLFFLTIRDADEYQKLFDGVRGETAVGEASVRYLYFKHCAQEIKNTVPDAKIIIVLRDPIKRLYSHYTMMRGLYALEPLSISAAIDAETDRIKAGWDWDWHYLNVSRYGEQVQRYLDVFGQDQVRVLIYEEFAKNPRATLSTIYDFLGVSDNPAADISARSMPSYTPRSYYINRCLRGESDLRRGIRSISPAIYGFAERAALKLNKRSSIAMPVSIKTSLAEQLAADIDQVESLLGRDLPWRGQ